MSEHRPVPAPQRPAGRQLPVRLRRRVRSLRRRLARGGRRQPDDGDPAQPVPDRRRRHRVRDEQAHVRRHHDGQGREVRDRPRSRARVRRRPRGAHRVRAERPRLLAAARVRRQDLGGLPAEVADDAARNRLPVHVQRRRGARALRADASVLPAVQHPRPEQPLHQLLLPLPAQPLQVHGRRAVLLRGALVRQDAVPLSGEGPSRRRLHRAAQQRVRRHLPGRRTAHVRQVGHVPGVRLPVRPTQTPAPTTATPDAHPDAPVHDPDAPTDSASSPGKTRLRHDPVVLRVRAWIPGSLRGQAAHQKIEHNEVAIIVGRVDDVCRQILQRFAAVGRDNCTSRIG